MVSKTTALLLIGCNIGLTVLVGYVLVQYNEVKRLLKEHSKIDANLRENARNIIASSQKMLGQAEEINLVAKKLFQNREETKKAKQDVREELAAKIKLDCKRIQEECNKENV